MWTPSYSEDYLLRLRYRMHLAYEVDRHGRPLDDERDRVQLPAPQPVPEQPAQQDDWRRDDIDYDFYLAD